MTERSFEGESLELQASFEIRCGSHTCRKTLTHNWRLHHPSNGVPCIRRVRSVTLDTLIHTYTHTLVISSINERNKLVSIDWHWLNDIRNGLRANSHSAQRSLFILYIFLIYKMEKPKGLQLKPLRSIVYSNLLRSKFLFSNNFMIMFGNERECNCIKTLSVRNERTFHFFFFFFILSSLMVWWFIPTIRYQITIRLYLKF